MDEICERIQRHKTGPGSAVPSESKGVSRSACGSSSAGAVTSSDGCCSSALVVWDAVVAPKLCGKKKSRHGRDVLLALLDGDTTKLSKAEGIPVELAAAVVEADEAETGRPVRGVRLCHSSHVYGESCRMRRLLRFS